MDIQTLRTYLGVHCKHGYIAVIVKLLAVVWGSHTKSVRFHFSQLTELHQV